MRKLFLVLIGAALISVESCKNAPEGTPGEEKSIETVSSSEDGVGDKVLIRLKPKVGDVQKTLMTMEMESTGTQAMKMNMDAKMNFKVIGKQGNVYDYEMKYNSIKMNMNAGGMDMSYDSEAKEHTGMGAMIHEQMKSFFENPMTMKMDERGNVTEFKLPGNMSAQQMGDMGSMSIPMPEGPVGVGDKWSADRKMDGTGNLKMNMTVEKITEDDLIIGTTGDMTDENGTKIGTFDGSYKLDRNSGLTKDGTMNMDLTAEGQPVKMKVNFKAI